MVSRVGSVFKSFLFSKWPLFSGELFHVVLLVGVAVSGKEITHEVTRADFMIHPCSFCVLYCVHCVFFLIKMILIDVHKDDIKSL